MDKYIYLHKKPNGQIFYVGQGINRRAWAKSNRNDYWKRTVDKYGDYSITIFKEGLTLDEANKLEMDLIEAIGLDNLTNLTLGGDGVKGRIWTDEERKKIGDIHRGGTSWSKGIKFSEEHKRKISEARMGYKMPLKSRKKLAESKKRKIKQFDLNDNFIKEYNSIKSAVEETGLNHISIVVRGIGKTAGGYKWKYSNNNK